jgi:hypothetical protein
MTYDSPIPLDEGRLRRRSCRRSGSGVLDGGRDRRLGRLGTPLAGHDSRPRASRATDPAATPEMQSGPAPKIAMRSAERRAHPRKVRPRLANVAVASCRRDHLSRVRLVGAPQPLGSGRRQTKGSNRGAHAPRKREVLFKRGIAGARAYPACSVGLFDIVKLEAGPLGWRLPVARTARQRHPVVGAVGTPLRISTGAKARPWVSWRVGRARARTMPAPPAPGWWPTAAG